MPSSVGSGYFPAVCSRPDEPDPSNPVGLGRRAAPRPMGVAPLRESVQPRHRKDRGSGRTRQDGSEVIDRAAGHRLGPGVRSGSEVDARRAELAADDTPRASRRGATGSLENPPARGPYAPISRGRSSRRRMGMTELDDGNRSGSDPLRPSNPRNRTNRLCRWDAYHVCHARSLVRLVLVASMIVPSRHVWDPAAWQQPS
jgi:hypothetical protein